MNYKQTHVIEKGLNLSYNRVEGLAHLSPERPDYLNDNWQTFNKIPFEHSDTCPSRLYRQREEDGLVV